MTDQYTPGSFIIHMPMKSYLRKFLQKKYGTNYEVSSNSLLGIFLIEILDKQYRKDHKKIIQKDYYPLIIPKYIVERVGFDMPTSKMKRFEEMLVKLFKTELESYIKLTIESELYVKIDDKKYRQDIMKAIKQYLDYFDITEDELKLESLYRDFNRNKQTNIGQKIAV